MNSLPRFDQALLSEMERTLYGATPVADAKFVASTLKKCIAAIDSEIAALEGPVHEASYALGARVMLKEVLLRIAHRKEGDQALAFLNRKHVANIHHALARSPDGLSPSEIAQEVGVSAPAASALLKEAEQHGLVQDGVPTREGQRKAKVLTPFGKAALTKVKPDWALSSPVRAGAYVLRSARTSIGTVQTQRAFGGGFANDRVVISGVGESLVDPWAEVMISATSSSAHQGLVGLVKFKEGMKSHKHRSNDEDTLLLNRARTLARLNP